MKVRDITRLLEEWAPPFLQESYDNSGLIVGSLDATITKVLVSLDCTEEVVKEAEREGAGLIVSHHPIVFSGLKRLTGANYVERTVLRAIKSGIALYAIHTNLDNIKSGVNFELATALGCLPESLKILRPKADLLDKVTVYCPEDHLEKVKEAMFSVGAGSIGNYDNCSFSSSGESTFRPNQYASPFVGEIGEKYSGSEAKIEVLVERWKTGNVISAASQVHPYEEMAYFITPISNKEKNIGAGMIGKLAEPIEWQTFLENTKSALNVTHLKHTYPPKEKVRTIAVCGGSGAFLLRDAISKNADVFVTSDFKYHEFFDAENKILIADVGHYESEWRTSNLIVSRINHKFTNFAVRLATTNTNPVQIR
ncbi:MAG: Nif3-like dinuclear metal center hexameric protein [Bacteroidetes bacterium]|nr:MAG: Nif3-like dinuclear metal center hexameric protein [Bacteroidota bacterium]